MSTYDDTTFFEKYQSMDRSQKGLEGAGEWPALQKLLPDFKNKRVLDIGCGYGWHCFYCIEQGASSVVGIDPSLKMLQVAESKKAEKGISVNNQITFQQLQMEDMDFEKNSFDVVISSLAFHYTMDFDLVVKKINDFLQPGGQLVFSVEHPIFTSYGSGDWYYNEKKEIDHWPVDHYFKEGARFPNFLGCQVKKYHKTLTTYINTLLVNGFQLNQVVEPLPEPEMLAKWPDETRRPMMLLISATKL
ncbi:S-adenosyl-L-methionine-dependent methyltransferase [Cunninghamella echinulata]|nr:S-adenosyl-L-methionine-dependent methyltransferase [Cunninghamella echinulata]